MVFTSVKVTNGLLPGSLRRGCLTSREIIRFRKCQPKGAVETKGRRPYFQIVGTQESFHCFATGISYHLIHRNVHKANSNGDEGTNPGLWLLASPFSSYLTSCFWILCGTGMRLEDLLVMEERASRPQPPGFLLKWTFSFWERPPETHLFSLRT